MFGRNNNQDFNFSRILTSFSQKIAAILRRRLDQSRIDNLAALIEFIHTRSAYVAQTSLYGYLKTRMGTQYRVIFEDPAFAGPLANAKWRSYAACLSDLCVFAISTISRAGESDASESAQLARHCFSNAVQATFDDCDIADLKSTVIEQFARRSNFVDWQTAGDLENAFTTSPEELINSAPVVEEYKDLDREIVTNSIRFRWRDVREQYRKRVDGEAIRAEWHAIENEAGRSSGAVASTTDQS
jgi:hypothetical protein